MPRVILDLADFQPEGSKIFAGREAGSRVRHEARIPTWEKGPDELEVRIPAQTYTVSSSFFLALFGETIRNLTPDVFRRRVIFVGQDISAVVEQAIWEATEAAKPFSLS
jgi:hypothetical protein